ncbi:MDIS1-interacting receptor like kinase [Trifolium repens]|nr:MDIS1-interacting receptor like kinase [Trifolium repens]
MKITEKCDVYSFGVLTLEILFEKHPEDIVSTYLYLSDCVSLTADGMSLIDKLDQRLSHPTNAIMKDMASIIILSVVTHIAQICYIVLDMLQYYLVHVLCVKL